MILGRLNQIADQFAQTPLLLRAIDYLKSIDVKTLQDGRFSVQGEEVIAIIETLLTRNITEQLLVEGHRKYIDIHYVIDGRESYGWIPTESFTEVDNYDEEKDNWTKLIQKKDLQFFELRKGDVVIFFLADAHISQLAQIVPVQTRKIVMKVKY